MVILRICLRIVGYAALAIVGLFAAVILGAVNGCRITR